MSSNVEHKVYQLLIQRDGISLVSSDTQLFSYPNNPTVVTSMTTSNGKL